MMTEMTTALRVRGTGLGAFPLVRAVVVALLVVLMVPTALGFTSAQAAEDDPANYSLYNLASNASTYFGQENSPQGDGKLKENWEEVTSSAANGGSMLGYSDPQFSVSDVVGWAFNEVSGSSQSIRFETFRSQSEANKGADYSGMLDYAQFGAANASLGFDSMSGGSMSGILSAIAGGIVWGLYALALSVNMLFWAVIQVLQLLNPFQWFFAGVANAGDGSADSAMHQREIALGMVDGQQADSQSLLGQIQAWVSTWYGLLMDLSWQVMVPLFLAVLLFSLVMLKNANRGSMIKKFVVRLIFIGLGLPLLGSLYTATLNQFDGQLFGQHSGPTRVVLSTYVDFDSWAMNDRLAIPEQAQITWSNGQAGPAAMMNARTSALAINASANKSFAAIQVGNSGTSADASWKSGTAAYGGAPAQADIGQGTDASSVLAVFNILNRYISGTEVSAADFESGIKTEITRINGVESKDKAAWFDSSGEYGKVDGFGGKDNPAPADHPVISVAAGQGLQSEIEVSDVEQGGWKRFTTTESARNANCGFRVIDPGSNGKPASCNLSPLAMYNYLNTGFGPDALTLYSSNKATSGFTRENHMAVSQVGTGPVKLTFWMNTVAILGVIVMLGLTYALGMLFGTIKRIWGLLAAVPFATLGFLSGIARVLIYAVVLIVEILVTLFLYQFVSEIIVVLPSLLTGPMSSFLGDGELLGTRILGTVAIVVLTLLSTLIILAIGFALMRVRSSVMRYIDEQTTKLVNRFLETDAPATGAGQPGPGSGIPGAVAGGLGAAGGAALGSRLAQRGGGGDRLGKPDPVPSPPGHHSLPDGKPDDNAPALGGGAGGLMGLSGSGDNGGQGTDGTDGTGGPGGGRGPGGTGSGRDGMGVDGVADDGVDGTQGAAGTGAGNQDADDRSTADRLRGQGGLTDYGFGSRAGATGADGAGQDGAAGAQSAADAGSQAQKPGTAQDGLRGERGSVHNGSGIPGADGAGTSRDGAAGSQGDLGEQGAAGDQKPGAAGAGYAVGGTNGSTGIGRDGTSAQASGLRGADGSAATGEAGGAGSAQQRVAGSQVGAFGIHDPRGSQVGTAGTAAAAGGLAGAAAGNQAGRGTQNGQAGQTARDRDGVQRAAQSPQAQAGINGQRTGTAQQTGLQVPASQRVGSGATATAAGAVGGTAAASQRSGSRAGVPQAPTTGRSMPARQQNTAAARPLDRSGQAGRGGQAGQVGRTGQTGGNGSVNQAVQNTNVQTNRSAASTSATPSRQNPVRQAPVGPARGQGQVRGQGQALSSSRSVPSRSVTAPTQKSVPQRSIPQRSVSRPASVSQPSKPQVARPSTPASAPAPRVVQQPAWSVSRPVSAPSAPSRPAPAQKPAPAPAAQSRPQRPAQPTAPRQPKVTQSKNRPGNTSGNSGSGSGTGSSASAGGKSTKGQMRRR